MSDLDHPALLGIHSAKALVHACNDHNPGQMHQNLPEHLNWNISHVYLPENKEWKQKRQIQGCIGTIVILAIIVAVVVNNWQNNERQPNQNSLLREVEQATMTPCARTIQEIDRATLIYGRMEESNTASTRLDGLCDVNFHYWTDKPTEYERYDERNQLLRSIGTVIKEESLPVGRLNLRTYAPNRSGSYLLWKHEIFQKSELPYN